MSETRERVGELRTTEERLADALSDVDRLTRQAATDAETLADAQAKIDALSVRRCGCGHYTDEHDSGRYKCVHTACKCTGFVPSPMTMVFVEAQRQEREAHAEALAEVDRLTARWEALKEAAGNYRLSPTCSRNWAFDNMTRLEQEP